MPQRHYSIQKVLPVLILESIDYGFEEAHNQTVGKITTGFACYPADTIQIECLKLLLKLRFRGKKLLFPAPI